MNTQITSMAAAMPQTLLPIAMDVNMKISQEFIEALPGAAVIEFGSVSCGYCQQAQSLITAALKQYAVIRHINIEDGTGQRLGRAYAIKRWPTLLFIKDGVEITRLVRPNDSTMIVAALNHIRS